jgi:hypothetical protein
LKIAKVQIVDPFVQNTKFAKVQIVDSFENCQSTKCAKVQHYVQKYNGFNGWGCWGGFGVVWASLGLVWVSLVVF